MEGFERTQQQKLSKAARLVLRIIWDSLIPSTNVRTFIRTPESKGRGRISIIDYFKVKKALRSGVADMKVIRGETLGSDHYLVLMKVRLKLRKPRKKTGVTRQKLRVNKLAEKSTTTT